MNKIVLIIVGVLLFTGVAGYAVLKSSASQDQTSSMNTHAANDHNKPHTHDDSHPHKDSAAASEVQSGTVAMDIKDFDFQKPVLKIKAGTTVTWTNKDEAKHDVNPDQSSDTFQGSGELLAQGESYSYTFREPGMYTYHCTPHPYMKASVEVVE